MLINNGMSACQLPPARWRKSSASNPSGSCVEIAELPGGAIAVRNSRDREGPALVYPRAEMAAFLRGMKNGEFDALVRLCTPVWFTPVWPRYPHELKRITTRRTRGDIVLCAPDRRVGLRVLPASPLSAVACP